MKSVLLKATKEFLAQGTQESKIARDKCVNFIDEFLRFLPTNSEWVSVVKLIRQIAQLSDFEVPDQAALPNAQMLVPLRKALADMQELLSADMNFGGIDGVVVAALRTKAQEAQRKYSEASDRLLKAAYASAMDHMRNQEALLREKAYGGAVDGTAWSATAHASMDLPSLIKLSADSLKRLDVEELDARVQNAQHAKSALESAASHSGLVLDEALVGEIDKLITRAVVTKAERGLLDLAENPPRDADELRAKIQSNIKLMRQQSIKEKEVLHASLFKWAYTALTKRH